MSLAELGQELLLRLYPFETKWPQAIRGCSDLSIGIIGFGKMGLVHAGISGLLVPGSVRVVIDKSRLIVMGASRLIPGLRFGTRLEDLLKSEEPNAVFVTAPTEYHVEVLRELGELGYRGYVFVEKPPARDTEELKSAPRVFAERSMTGFQKRFAAPFRHLELLLRSREIGEVEDVRATIFSSDILGPTQRFDKLGRGVLLDLGVHVIDLLLWLFGDLSPEDARCRSRYTGVDDEFSARLVTRDGVLVELEASWSRPGLREPEALIEARGEKGVVRATEDYLDAELAEPSLLLGGRREARLYRPHYYQGWPPALLAHHEHVVEDMHFFLNLCSGGEPVTSLRRVEPVMKLIDALYEMAGRCRT